MSASSRRATTSLWRWSREFAQSWTRFHHQRRQDPRREAESHQGQGDPLGGEPESGTATEDVGATYSAGALEIGFNARYLLDITSQIEGKEVRFLLSDAGSPAIIEDADNSRTLMC